MAKAKKKAVKLGFDRWVEADGTLLRDKNFDALCYESLNLWRDVYRLSMSKAKELGISKEDSVRRSAVMGLIDIDGLIKELKGGRRVRALLRHTFLIGEGFVGSLVPFLFLSEKSSDGVESAASEFARRIAQVRWMNDPKTNDKAFVKECWLEWQKEPKRYTSKAEFARDMLTKCENLKSNRVIEDWVREWERNSAA